MFRAVLEACMHGAPAPIAPLEQRSRIFLPLCSLGMGLAQRSPLLHRDTAVLTSTGTAHTAAVIFTTSNTAATLAL